METLLDANRGLSRDLPTGYLKRQAWLEAGKILVQAAESGADRLIEEATEKLLAALETEGWMDRQPISRRISG